jgi:hypothetical protein
MSDKAIVDWIAKLKEQVKAIYLTYYKPYECELIINTQTVETEPHS